MKDALCSRRDFVAATALLGPTALLPSPNTVHIRATGVGACF